MIRTPPERRIAEADEADCEWFLAADDALFHVYAVVRFGDRYTLRIDWLKESVLTFEPMTRPDGSLAPLGRGRFNYAALARVLAPLLRGRHYSLLRLNCRTVTFLVLTKVGFDAERLLARYERHQLLCGLVTRECFSAATIRELVAWLHAKAAARRIA